MFCKMLFTGSYSDERDLVTVCTFLSTERFSVQCVVLGPRRTERIAEGFVGWEVFGGGFETAHTDI